MQKYWYRTSQPCFKATFWYLTKIRTNMFYHPNFDFNKASIPELAYILYEALLLKFLIFPRLVGETLGVQTAPWWNQTRLRIWQEARLDLGTFSHLPTFHLRACLLKRAPGRYFLDFFNQTFKSVTLLTLFPPCSGFVDDGMCNPQCKVFPNHN